MKRILTILFVSFTAVAFAQQDAGANYQAQIDSLNSQLKSLRKELQKNQMQPGMGEAMQKLNEAMKSLDNMRIEMFIDSNGRRMHYGYFKFPDSMQMNVQGLNDRNFMPPTPPFPPGAPGWNDRTMVMPPMKSDSLQMRLDELSQELKGLNGESAWQYIENFPSEKYFSDSLRTDEFGDSITVIRLGKSSRVIIKHPDNHEYEYNYDSDKDGNEYHYHYNYNKDDDSDNDNNSENYSDDDRDNNEYHSRHQSNLSTYWLGLDLGFNTYLNKGNSNLPSLYEPLSLNHGKSVVVNIRVVEQQLNLASHILFLNYGLGFELNNFRFNTQQVLVPKLDTVGFSDYAAALSKYKLADIYITVPIALTLHTSQRDHHSFLFSVGPDLGYLIGAHTKLVSDANGKVKFHDDYNLSPFKYGLTGRIGFGVVTLWGTYDFNPFFANGVNPDLTPISFGIGLSPW